MSGTIEVNDTTYSLNLVPSTPDQRDYLFTVQEQLTLQDTYDLVAGFTYDQGQQGSCTANAQAKIFRMLLKFAGFSDWLVSRAMVYYMSRLRAGNQNSDAGATIADSMAAFADSGACSEATMPYHDNVFNQAPSQAALTEGLDHQVLAYGIVPQTADSIGAALDAKHPVSVGFVVYDNFNPDPISGIIPMPSGSARGGHDVDITGRYHSRRLYIIDNSWSEQWGITISDQPGRALIPYDYIHNPQLCFEAKAMTMVEGVITPPPPPQPTPTPTNRAFHYDRFVRTDVLKYNDNGEEFTWISSGRYN